MLIDGNLMQQTLAEKRLCTVIICRRYGKRCVENNQDVLCYDSGYLGSPIAVLYSYLLYCHCSAIHQELKEYSVQSNKRIIQ